jgi:class 3 adenylate cyclase/predicted ATPase
MFCDLVGSTSLSERLDPEDLRKVLRAYQAACAEVIDRYDGHIAKYIGDGLMVYFGYPQAHENDAERAVHAGLEMVAQVVRLSEHLTEEKGIDLAVRLGLHTGLVIAGEMGAGKVRENLAIVGETPNVAARLEALAEPNNVVISDGTRRLVEGLFVCEPLGPQRLKGITEPLEVFRVISESKAHTRFEAAAERGLPPLIGREEEIGLLLKRWNQAKDGEGQVVVLSGEAGVGKSRILRGFRDRLEGEPHNRVLYYCSPYHRNSAFYPVIDQLERVLRFVKDDDPAARLDKLDGVLTDLNLATAYLGPLFANLLSVPTDDRYPELGLGPEQVKRGTVEAVIQVVAMMARQRPVLMVVEDAHWIDPTTLELLNLLVEQIASTRVLLFVAHRPEFEPPWRAGSHVTGLALNRLSRKESGALVLKLTNGKALPETVMDQILDKTDGVPLFVEELTKTVLESGFLEDLGDRFELSAPLPPFAIPASLQDSLMARLDRLAPAKEVAQLAATLGRVFGHDLLAAVSPLEAAALEDALSQLVDAGLIYRRGFGPEASYDFKHALVRDAAYQSLLKSTRQQYHQRIADVLEQHFPEIAEAEPEILAHHCTEAQNIDKAVDYWHRAGTRAIERSANLEAVAHLTRALELLEAQPENDERARRELGLRVSLGVPLTSTKGPGAPDVYESYSRARTICQRFGDASQTFLLLWGLWRCCQATGRMREARNLGDELLSLAQQHGDPEWILEAHHVQWTNLTKLGEPAACWEQAKQGIALYEPEQHRVHVFSYTDHDPGVCCRGVGGMSLWSMGYPDQARTRELEAMELADKLEHPSSQALARIFSSYVFLLRGEFDMARDCLDAASARSTEQGFAHYLLTAKILRGWLLARGGGATEGLELIREGVESGRARGTGVTDAYFLMLLAEAYGRVGKPAMGLEVLGQALADIEETGARMFESEMLRMRGEFLLRGNGEESLEAEVCFTNALDISRRQQARSLELRAASSLARLWRGYGRTREARDLLAPIYGWFTEGFDTADLQEAKALLDELA